jgi:hypothetical protein
MMINKKNEASICNHDGTNKKSQAYSQNSQHGHQNAVKDIPRESM